MPFGTTPKRFGALILTATLCLASLVLSAVVTRERAMTNLAERGEQALKLFVANLESEVEKYAFLPQVLATDRSIIAALKGGPDSPAAARASILLADINSIASTSDTYLMRADGLTIAASNYAQPHSFIGRNFSFRPYFKIARAGGQGRYFALGTTSNIRGYYFSAPVYDDEDDSVLGVAVVKVSMERLEAAWRDSGTLMLLTDAHGVIFSATREGWQFRSLRPLPKETHAALIASRQYIDKPLTALPISARERYAELEILGVAGSPELGAAGYYLVQQVELPRSEWRALALSSTAEVSRSIRTAIALNLLGLAVVLMLAAMLLNRRRSAQQRARLRERTEHVLRRLHERLEVRVRLRTRELSESNTQLQREIDQHRRTTEELKLAQVELVQAGKLAALGQLAAGITHEINQPLTAIRTYADNAGALLQRGRGEEAAENLRDISELTERMAQITGHLKTYARKSDGQLSSVPLLETAQRALALLKVKANGLGAQVQINIDPTLCVQADAVRLEQVLLNLFNNALDAMKHRAEKHLDIRAEARDGQIDIRVRDTGPGIDAEHLDKLFDPFFTTKGVGDGLGLGLSISHGIVQQFGGELRAANHPEGGAEFQLRLLPCPATETPA